MRGTPRYIAGSRFKYTPDYIDFSYKNLVDAIGEAIDKQAAEDGSEYFTDEKVNLYNSKTELDFDELVNEFNSMVNYLIESKSEEEFEQNWSPRISQITDRYLGRGQKVNQCSREQTEALDLIVTDMRDLIKNN